MKVRKLLTLTGMLVGAVALVSLTACAEKPTETPFPKQNPKVTITGIQISGGVTRIFASGTDEDGQVAFYRYQIDGGAVVDSVTSSIYDAQITYANMDDKHYVSAWAVDNDGRASAPATLTFSPASAGAANRTPDTEIISPRSGAVTSNGVVVTWNARDPDGSVTGYQIQFDKDGWEDVTETVYQKVGLAAGSHTIQVRAKDNFDQWDPTPASVTITVQAGLKPELNTSGVTDGATFFVPPGGTVDLRIGWEAAADFYFGEVAGFAYDFNSTGQTPYTNATENVFAGLGEGDYAVDVYAKDIGGNEAQKTISFSIVVPALTDEVLVVNGIHWGTYGGLLNAVYPVFLASAAAEPWDYWDLFGTPAAGYPAGMNVNKLGNGAITGATIGKYKAVLWHGNNYSGDLELWNADLIAGYVAAGGKMLLNARRTVTFFNDELQSMAHITGFLPDLSGTFTAMQATAAGVALGLQDVAFPSGNSLAGGITGTDGSDLVETIFVDGSDPSSILGVRAKAKAGDDWNIVVIAGRQYRANPPEPMAANYRTLLTGTLGVTPPAAP